MYVYVRVAMHACMHAYMHTYIHVDLFIQDKMPEESLEYRYIRFIRRHRLVLLYVDLCSLLVY
jgi:hypothetical protein